MSERLKIYKDLNKFMKFNNSHVTFLLIVSTLSVLPEIAYPFVFKYFIDNVLAIGNFSNIIFVVLSFVIIFIFSVFISYLLIYTRNKSFKSKIIMLKQLLLKSFITKDFIFYKKTKPSELKMIIDTDTAAVNEFLNIQIVDHFKNISIALVMSIIMLYLNWLLFIGCFIFFVISLLQTKSLRKKASDSFEESREQLSKETDKIREMLYQWREIKSLNLEGNVAEQYYKGLKNISRYTYKEKIYDFISYYFGALNNFLISNFFLYIAGGLLIISNQLSISSFLIFTGFYASFVFNIQVIISNNLKLGKNIININKVLKELANENNLIIQPSKDNNDYQNHLELIGINFKYNKNSSKIMDNFSYEFTENNKYLLKGRSGVGKSTLAKLITGEYKVDSGKILFNGIPFNKLVNKDNVLSLVSKESKLFNTTILENLLYANGRAKENEVERACKFAEIYELIETLPEKYNTVIGENGIKLSGGEKQRLALARLFLRSSRIYILDESTSEIGTDAEYRIINRLTELNPSSIFIIISHREIDIANKKIITI